MAKVFEMTVYFEEELTDKEREKFAIAMHQALDEHCPRKHSKKRKKDKCILQVGASRWYMSDDETGEELPWPKSIN